MRDQRARLSVTERERAATAAGAHLAALPEVRSAVAARAHVAGFAATRDEIDPARVLDDLRARGVPIAWPRIEDPAAGVPASRLRFHVPASRADLAPGRFGIDEPPAAAPEVAAGDVAVMILPGLAFDGAGRRLGFGGGYYDELLAPARPRPGLVVGLAYDFQVVDACPADERDARVDCVVTDARVIRCTGGDRPPAPARTESMNESKTEKKKAGA